jgi:hypothetical protein
MYQKLILNKKDLKINFIQIFQSKNDSFIKINYFYSQKKSFILFHHLKGYLFNNIKKGLFLLPFLNNLKEKRMIFKFEVNVTIF